MQRVYVATSLPGAQLIADMLAHHGLAARVLNTHASTLSGEIPVYHTGPQVWIDSDSRDDWEAARALIVSTETAPSSDATRVCSRCHEESPASFALCWQCGSEL